MWYAAWIARRWQDPAFPSAFPHFGTPEYWDREVLDLEQQLEQLLEDGDAPGSQRPETGESGRELLTNEDYFWDL